MQRQRSHSNIHNFYLEKLPGDSFKWHWFMTSGSSDTKMMAHLNPSNLAPSKEAEFAKGAVNSQVRYSQISYLSIADPNARILIHENFVCNTCVVLFWIVPPDIYTTLNFVKKSPKAGRTVAINTKASIGVNAESVIPKENYRREWSQCS